MYDILLKNTSILLKFCYRPCGLQMPCTGNFCIVNICNVYYYIVYLYPKYRGDSPIGIDLSMLTMSLF